MTTQQLARTAVATMLEPRSIAIVGISTKPQAPSRRILAHLLQDRYAGDIHLVGRSPVEIEGRPVLAGVDELPEGVDLALLILPASGVKDAVAACIRRKVRVAVLYAAGFAELGDAGRTEQAEISRLAHDGGLALVGPNCIGFINYVNPLDTIFIPQIPVPRLPRGTEGALAVLAQSGGIMAMVREGLRARGVPISYCISTGNEAGLNLTDYLDHLADDPTTRGVVAYVEDIRDPAGLLAAVRRMRAQGKAMVLMHTGRSERGKMAAASHTGALAADYGVMKTLLSRAGACVVESLEELTDVGEILARYPNPESAGTAVVTTSGAFCSIALDALSDLDVEVPELSPHTVETLAERMPAYLTPGNPLDLGTVTATDPALNHDGLAAVLDDDRISTVVVAVPFVSAEANLRMLEECTRAAAGQPKPVAIGLLGDAKPLDEDFKRYAREHGMVVSNSPERLIRAMATVARYGRAMVRGTAIESAVECTSSGLGSGARSEWMGKKFLAEHGVSVPDGELATDVEQAVKIAAEVGYPVAAKAQAADLQHKTEAGALVLGIPDENALRAAWDELTDRVSPEVQQFEGVLIEEMAPKGVELMVGAKRHPQWGPVVMVGLGGIWVEALGDVRLIPPDLSQDEIIAELRALRAAKLLGDFRGSAAVDLNAVARVVSSIGRLMLTHPDIAELDINPLVARSNGVTALDALIVCSTDDPRRQG
ncbi:acetate--CoA ligase family protein [Rhodococcus sp. Rp3]|uniref:acetate--CoA ligase family protein n=1 Tax=Rhodococcus sp. Rp3 TaxID=2807635 RepID=UPI00233E6A4E|nr:acetate--CoA ligase family protein [Rhodococcus sp. Rp3]MDC3724394.1 acetate--CoA ligase family protein [Rhodococcus sp. Rp3]